MHIHPFMGRTSYIDADINIGLYSLNGTDIVIIDTGMGKDESVEALRLILEAGLQVVAILLTHSHSDHCGGALLFKKAFPRLKIYAPDIERQFIENPQLMGLFVYPSTSFAYFLQYRHKPTKVNGTFKGNSILIDGVSFGLVNLAGHSPNMTGIVTPDNVLYASDAYVTSSYVEEAKILYSFDLEKDLEVKQELLGSPYSGIIMSHGKPETSPVSSILSNLAYYNHFLEVVEDILETPHTLESLVQILIERQSITLRPFSFLIAQGSVAGLLVYLEKHQRIEMMMVEGKMAYRAKK
jgi:glyoxylase-like metal-dependent hydrolase (beta-lactamase superfamily II)